jgi:hypothetical protein
LYDYEGAQKEILNEEVRDGKGIKMGSEIDLGKLDSKVAAGVKSKRQVVEKKSAGFRLTERDIELLGFLLDQKFASLEQVYFRFFDVRQKVSDELPQNLFVTRQRLQVLRRAGLVTTEKVFSESKSLYLLTTLGFQIFRARRPHDAFSSPAKDVDFRNYDHDTKVNDCRIAIERTGKVMKWLPERRLRAQGFESEFSWSELPKELVPDGIFISKKNGDRIAFEIETTPRKKSRYEEKRDGFLSVMTGKSPLLHRVIWVGFTDRVFSDLTSVAGKHAQFSVESYSHFLSKLWPRGVMERIKP